MAYQVARMHDCKSGMADKTGVFFTLLHVPHVLYMPYQRFTNGATVNHTLLHSNHAVSNLSQNSFTVGASHNDIFMVNV